MLGAWPGLGAHSVAMQPYGQAGSAIAERAVDRAANARACPPADDWPGGVPPPSSGVRSHLVTAAALCVAVSSNGCTDRGSFEVSVTPGDPIRIILKRLQPDRCRMKSHRIWLELGWQELGLNGPRPVVVEEREGP
jgi:hypothetical protein